MASKLPSSPRISSSAKSSGLGFRDDEGDDWDDDDVYGLPDDRPMRVGPHLYIGSFLAERNLLALQASGITHVLQVAEGLGATHSSELKYLQVHAQDVPGEDLVAHFPRCFAFIDDAIDSQGGVLVHCVAGVSRSATVLIGYLMWKHQLGYEPAFRRVHCVRPWVMPNAGFQRQLHEFEKMGCDPARWRAWRHSCAPTDEEPIVVKLKPRPPGQQPGAAGRAGAASVRFAGLSLGEEAEGASSSGAGGSGGEAGLGQGGAGAPAGAVPSAEAMEAAKQHLMALLDRAEAAEASSGQGRGGEEEGPPA